MDDLTATISDNTDLGRECAFYGRYSSPKQKESSIEDQIRVCRAEAERIGGHIPDANIFSDPEVRGALEDRPQLNRLMAIIRSGQAAFRDLIIADTSRLARNSALAPKIRKTCDHHGIRLHFVQNGMKSGSSGFNLQHTFQAYFDESYSSQLGIKVYEGQVGVVKKGQTPSGRCYGYRTVADEHPFLKSLYERPLVLGARHVIHPEEARVIVMIFEMYSSGFGGYHSIAKHLNALGIESPRKPKKNTIRCWGHAAVKCILQNERYIGHVTYGRMESKRNPDTGALDRRRRPESEWTRHYNPAIRIVSDELWTAVVARRKLVGEIGGPVAGGMARSGASQSYLFSGLLRCGVCQGTMIMANGPKGSYHCGTNRRGAGCTNKQSIRFASVQRELAFAIASTIRSQTNFETVKAQFMMELTTEVRRREDRAKDLSGSAADLVSERKALIAALERLADEVGLTGGSETIRNAISKKEARKTAIDAQLAEAQMTTTSFSEEEIAAFLRKSLENLAELILGDPSRAKAEIQKRVRGLILTPTTCDGRAAYQVTGDVTLFSGSDLVLLGDSVDCMTKQHSFVLKLDGMTLKLDELGAVTEVVESLHVFDRTMALEEAA